MSRPTLIRKASSRKAWTGTSAVAANEAARTIPAAEIARDAPAPAITIASSSGRRLASAHIRPTRKTL